MPSSNVKRLSNIMDAPFLVMYLLGGIQHLITRVVFVELQDYVDKFTGIREHGLRQFELTREEWDGVKQLVKVLQVSACYFTNIYEANDL
jgi:hypothetical protein